MSKKITLEPVSLNLTDTDCFVLSDFDKYEFFKKWYDTFCDEQVSWTIVKFEKKDSIRAFAFLNIKAIADYTGNTVDDMKNEITVWFTKYLYKHDYLGEDYSNCLVYPTTIIPSNDVSIPINVRVHDFRIKQYIHFIQYIQDCFLEDAGVKDDVFNTGFIFPSSEKFLKDNPHYIPKFRESIIRPTIKVSNDG